MFCNQFENEGILYIYDELDAGEKREFEAHFLNCSDCRMAIRQLADTRDIYRELETEIPSMRTLRLLKIKSQLFYYLTIYRKFLSKLFKPKKIWIPATVSSIALIFICLLFFGIFEDEQKLVLKPEEILEWTILNDDSIKSLDQQIEGIFAEKITINESTEGDNKIASTDLKFEDDFGLNKIQQDIILLSWDIDQPYF